MSTQSIPNTRSELIVSILNSAGEEIPAAQLPTTIANALEMRAYRNIVLEHPQYHILISHRSAEPLTVLAAAVNTTIPAAGLPEQIIELENHRNSKQNPTLFELLDTARTNGIKKPRLHFATHKIKQAPASGKNPGFLYFYDLDGEYAGKISPTGMISPNSDTPIQLVNAVRESLANPIEAIINTGKQTGTCCCCGRALTNPVSISAGIGPICAGVFDLVSWYSQPELPLAPLVDL